MLHALKIRPVYGALLLSLASLSLQAQQTVVRTEQVAQEQLQQHERVTGSLRAYSDANLAVRESGYIAKVLVNEGDRVEKGQLLVQLNDQRLKATLDQLTAEEHQARAQVSRRLAELKNAQQDLDAFTYSASRKAISEQQLRRAATDRDVAKAALAESKANLVALEARLQLARVRYADAQLLAPFNGTVTERMAEPGEWLNQGTTAITMVADEQLEAWLEVPERFASLALSDADTISLRINGEQLMAKGAKVAGRVDSRARTFSLIANIDNAAHQWMPGMSVSGWIPTSQKQAVLTVSKSAIMRRNGTTLVYKVMDSEQGQSAMPVPVSVLFETGEKVAISTQAMQPGDQVVYEGNERLMPGPVVAVKDESPSQLAGSSAASAAKASQ